MSNRLTTAELIELTVNALCEAPADRGALELAHELIASGEGRSLFDALFAARQGQPGALMTMLERAIDANVRVGTYLMARLLPVCGLAHDVFDGIELWMDALRDPEAAKVLRVLASEKVSPSLQARYERWSETIARRGAIRVHGSSPN
jgi:hypothetical protein